MFKLEIIDGKGIFLNGVKIEPVIGWAVESDDYCAQIVTLRLQVDEVKMDCGFETRQKNLSEMRKR
ncbi:MAG: hypothetical protein ACI4JQ_02145 [Ruminococcus sp.]